MVVLYLLKDFSNWVLRFGGTGGTDGIHLIVSKFDYDLDLFRYPTYDLLNTIQQFLGFETNVIYALFQEAIYCNKFKVIGAQIG